MACCRSTATPATTRSPIRRPGGSVTLAYCWSHLRRKFYVGGHSPIATQALLRIKEFHAVEDEARGLSPELRKRARHDRSKAIVEALKPWFDRSLTAVPRGGKIGEALAYGLNHWDGLTRFLDDGSNRDRFQHGRVRHASRDRDLRHKRQEAATRRSDKACPELIPSGP